LPHFLITFFGSQLGEFFLLDSIYHYFCIAILFVSHHSLKFDSCRVLNVQIGETSRLAWLGIEADPLVQSDSLLKAYNRPPEANVSKEGSKWFISKNTIVSGLGLLGLQQGNGDSTRETDAPKPRRKRVVRRKVSTA